MLNACLTLFELISHSHAQVTISHALPNFHFKKRRKKDRKSDCHCVSLKLSRLK